MWREAQRIKTENTPVKRTKSNAPIAYALRNILVCGCGKPMKGKASGGNGRPTYYICSDRKHFGPERCNRPVLKKPDVETAVGNFLHGLLGNPAAVSDYVQEAREQLRKQVPTSRQALAKRNRRSRM